MIDFLRVVSINKCQWVRVEDSVDPLSFVESSREVFARSALCIYVGGVKLGSEHYNEEKSIISAGMHLRN